MSDSSLPYDGSTNERLRRLAADVSAFDGNRVLLIRRKFDPDAGTWAAPGGYVEWDESAEDAAAREFREETGLLVRDLLLVKLQSSPTRHSSQFVTAVFAGRSAGTPHAGDDAADAEWFEITDLPAEMALDHRDSVLSAWDLHRRASR
jgi:8-oxo-dGTP diphosphatase